MDYIYIDIDFFTYLYLFMYISAIECCRNAPVKTSCKLSMVKQMVKQKIRLLSGVPPHILRHSGRGSARSGSQGQEGASLPHRLLGNIAA